MNILYCGDQNIFRGVMLSLLSLMEHVREPIHIYLLTAKVQTDARCFSPLTKSEAHFLDTMVKEQDEESFVRLIDITEQFSAQPPTANLHTRFTPCCMLRLYADLVNELPDRLLYLDNDVLCRLDPSDFYDQELTGCQLCGCLDHYGSWFFQRKPGRRDYLNSGVLLLNLPAIRASGLFEQCRALCRTKTMFMPDQSAINKLACRKRICHRRFNEQRKLRHDTVFQHFTTSFRFFPYIRAVHVKPWNIQGMHKTLKLHEYDALLLRYQTWLRQYNAKETAV